MIHFIPKEQKTFCLIFPQFYIQFILQSMSCRAVDGALTMQFDLKGSKHGVRDEYQVSYTFTQWMCVSDFLHRPQHGGRVFRNKLGVGYSPAWNTGHAQKGECLSRSLLMPGAHCALQTPNLNMTRADTPISLMRMLLDSSVQDTQSDTIFVVPCHCDTAPTDFNIGHTFCFFDF